jgi:hypothetical protein
MDFLVINAQEGDGERVANLTQSLKLNKFGVDTLIDVRFPWVSYVVVNESEFESDYLPSIEEYYFVPLHD